MAAACVDAVLHGLGSLTDGAAPRIRASLRSSERILLSESVLVILPNPNIGPFTKEDGEVVIDVGGKRTRWLLS